MSGGRRKKTRKMRGGVMYGPTSAIAPGALEWGGVDTSAPYSSATGAKVADPFSTSPDITAKATGGRRHKGKSKSKSRKTKKGGRRTKKRTMRGGRWTPSNVNSANTGYGFTGATEGVRGGIAPATGYQANIGGAPMNAAGVRTA